MAISLADKCEHILKQALVDLFETVDKAFTQEPQATGPENDRQRYAAALTAVDRFFGTFKAPFVGRFFDLASAITDLNNNSRAAPLLQPVRTGKRGGDSSLTWRRRAHAVLGLEGLMATRSETDALKLVGDLYKPETLRTWRKEISANRNERVVERLFEAKTVLELGREEISKIKDNGSALEAFVLS